MPQPLREFVRQILAEHGRGEKIRLSVEHANNRVKALAKNTTWRRKGTRRAEFWEAAVDKLIDLTLEDPGLHVLEHHDTISFIFDDAVLVRLKKADVTMHTSNYPTPLAELFDEHEADLFGHAGLQRVEAVYIPNQFETEILWIGIVAHDGDAKLWHYELAAPVTAAVTQLPTPVLPPTADLVKIKDQSKDKNRKKSGDDK